MFSLCHSHSVHTARLSVSCRVFYDPPFFPFLKLQRKELKQYCEKKVEFIHN